MRKRLLKYLVIAIVLLVVTVFSIDAYVSYRVKDQLYNSITAIGHNRIGVVLGTSKYVSTGHVNLYYKHRIRAAIQLFEAGKIDFIIVSGDNRKMNYNEPQTMKEDLIAAGIPESRIFLDYAGFRTLDSIIRSSAVFGASSITIISQKFHNERALFIANSKGLQAVAFNAQDPPQKFGVLVREKLARVKMVLDLLFNTPPKFYGPPVEVKKATYALPDIHNGQINALQLPDTVTVCNNWTIQADTLKHILKLFHTVQAQEWHYAYDVLPCSVTGKIIIDSATYNLTINAGSYMVLSNADTAFYFGCSSDSCLPYFVSSPLKEDERKVDL